MKYYGPTSGNPASVAIDVSSVTSNVHEVAPRVEKRIREPLKLRDFILTSNKAKVKSKNVKSHNKKRKGTYCLPNCKHDGYDKGEAMIRCCLCMRWVHPVSCCKDTEEDASSVGQYACSICRTFSTCLSNIEKAVENIQCLNKDLIRLLEAKEQECSDLRKLLQEKDIPFLPVHNQNEDIHRSVPVSHVSPVDSHQTGPTRQKSRPKPVPRPRKSLQESKPKLTLLGTSMARQSGPTIANILSNMDTCVYSISGLSLAEAANTATDVFRGHSQKDIAVLQVGTADLNELSVGQLTEGYDRLIETVEAVAPSTKIAVTAVPRRLSGHLKNNNNKKANMLNNHLRSKCLKSNNLIFIDAAPEPIQSFYKYDGLHFNQSGTSYFARYLSQYIKLMLNFPLKESVENP